jgi:hypothetical protein
MDGSMANRWQHEIDTPELAHWLGALAARL